MVLPLVAAASRAAACPVCVSDTGARVRAGIAADFARDLLVTIAPFVVLALLVALIQQFFDDPDGVPADGHRYGDCSRDRACDPS